MERGWWKNRDERIFRELTVSFTRACTFALCAIAQTIKLREQVFLRFVSIDKSKVRPIIVTSSFSFFKLSTLLIRGREQTKMKNARISDNRVFESFCFI